ncbi:heparan-alpha-glucosaminide N-acetyltransferase [Wyeomyia smithii]|uniref:heparan-alpha-glucosaminide N-acetyltransferase n=1 Tax=Wyeomyia smithii TaxID=174621 RepID=UPI002467C609|nr:heparan-alpha-glucosaminide N-acetyltransferase [Wyeomyia smithii]XP_055529976.1 heparan-alpha-glucosaminide N-acetyltransferase [Wyeomyia smithii]
MIEYTEQYFRGLDLWSLWVDQAFLNASIDGLRNYFLYSLSEDCEKCPYTRLHEIKNEEDSGNVLELDVARRLNFKIFEHNLGKYAFDNESFVCQLSAALGEFGVYDLRIKEGGITSCTLETAKEPVNIYLPFLTIALIIICLLILVVLGKKLLQRFHQPSRDAELAPASPESTKAAAGAAKTRLRSLDTFRGIAIMLMIFVNSGGGQYWWIEHATWNGLHVADLVFPWFLFIMGVCIPISLRSQLNRNVPKATILKNITIRSIKLFCIGLCLNSMNGPTLSELRIFGVLQRFGIAYLVVSVIHLYLYQENVQFEHPLVRRNIDIARLWKHWLVVGSIILVYLLIMFLVPAPGCPSGYFGPGGKHFMTAYQNCTGGITGYIDRSILGDSHLYQHPTARYMYDALSFDPEGPFGCLPTIFQVFLGLQCGVLMLTHTQPLARVKRLITWATILGLLGGILCGFSKNDGWIPVNKNLWSVSYVLVTASLAFLLLLICYLLVDVKGFWNGSPFLYAGMNAIILYVGHTVFHKMLPWHWNIGRMNTHFMLTLEALWNAALWNVIAFVLYRKKLFYSL